MSLPTRAAPLRLWPAVAAIVLSACGSSLLGPEAAQGIEGVALRGPMCPVQTTQNPCPDQPYQAWVQVLDGGGALVTRVRTGADGTFRVGLEPGRYTLDPESGSPFPTASPLDVEVVAGTFSDVVISFDTGIR